MWLLCSAGMDTSSSPPSSPAYARLINGATLSFPVKQPEKADSGLLCVLKRQNLGQWSRPWTNNHICMHIQLKGHKDEFLVFTLEAFYLKRQSLLQMKSYSNADINTAKIQQNSGVTVCVKSCNFSFFKSTTALTELQKHGINLRKVKAKSGERIQCIHITMTDLLHCKSVISHLSCPKSVCKLALMG